MIVLVLFLVKPSYPLGWKEPPDFQLILSFNHWVYSRIIKNKAFFSKKGICNSHTIHGPQLRRYKILFLPTNQKIHVLLSLFQVVTIHILLILPAAPHYKERKLMYERYCRQSVFWMYIYIYIRMLWQMKYWKTVSLYTKWFNKRKMCTPLFSPELKGCCGENERQGRCTLPLKCL